MQIPYGVSPFPPPPIATNFPPVHKPESSTPQASSMDEWQRAGTAMQPQLRAQMPPATGQPVAQAVSSSAPAPEIRATGRMDPAEIIRVSRVYYIELLSFFRLQAGQSTQLSGSRSNARDKLTRLSKLQFAELSTDVHDELKRRQLNAEGARTMPYLQGRNDYHPKRNQARQKLATLPKNRFRDLASDVFFELERRFPEFPAELRPEPLDAIMTRQDGGEQIVRSASQGGATPGSVPQVFPQGMLPQNATVNTIAQETALAPDQPAPVQHKDLGDTVAPPQNTPYVISTTAPADQPTRPTVSNPTAPMVQDQGALAQDGQGYGVDTSQADTLAAGTMIYTPERNDTHGAVSQPQMSTPKVFIPTKSTSVEETVVRKPEAEANDAMTQSGEEAGAPDAAAMHNFVPADDLNRMQDAYESRIAALLSQVEKLENDRQHDTENSVNAAMDSLRAQNDRLATRITELEEDVASHLQTVRDLNAKHEQNSVLFDAQSRNLEQARSHAISLQNQLDGTLEASRTRETAPSGMEEMLRTENDYLRNEVTQQQDVVQELRSEVASLLQELRALSTRNDAMMADKESDVAIIRDLHQQMSAFKRRYEQTRTELRALRTSSQLCSQPLRAEEGLHVSDRGAIADTNLAQFQSSIDELLAASRAPNSSSVLVAMKSVVLSTTLITDDIAKYESNSDNDLNELSEQQLEDLQTLKVSTSEALTNLMSACRNHASSQGLSPVGLVDAAASHVAMAIVEMIKLLKIRKTEDSLSSPQIDQGDETPASEPYTGLKPLHMSARTPSISSASSSSRRRPPPLSVGGTRSVSDREVSPRMEHAHPETDSVLAPRQRNPSTSRYSPIGYVNAPNSAPEWSAAQDENRPRLPSGASTQSPASQLRSDSVSLPPPRTPEAQSLRSFTRVQSGAFSPRPSSSGAGATNTRTISTSSYGAGEPVPPSTAPTTDADQFMENGENWAELRNYIEVQTEAIVHSIQSLLSALREGAQGVQLNENLTQITTIVSSIVAISQDHLPRSTSPRHGAIAQQAERIFADLSENCDRLIDMQSNASYDRTTKSIMASASYGVAKGLKALNELLNDVDEVDAA